MPAGDSSPLPESKRLVKIRASGAHFAPGFGAVIDTTKLNEWLKGLELESDRSVVLLACAFLDELARERLRRTFRGNPQQGEKLLTTSLSRFSSRVDALASLGEIDGVLAIELRRVNRLRNGLAHSWLPTLWTFAEAKDILAQARYRAPTAIVRRDGLDLRSQFMLLLLRLATALASCRSDGDLATEANDGDPS